VKSASGIVRVSSTDRKYGHKKWRPYVRAVRTVVPYVRTGSVYRP